MQKNILTKSIFRLSKLSSRCDAFESDSQMVCLVHSGCGFVTMCPHLHSLQFQSECRFCYMLLFFVVCGVSEKLHSGLILKLNIDLVLKRLLNYM